MQRLTGLLGICPALKYKTKQNKKKETWSPLCLTSSTPQALPLKSTRGSQIKALHKHKRVLPKGKRDHSAECDLFQYHDFNRIVLCCIMTQLFGSHWGLVDVWIHWVHQRLQIPYTDTGQIDKNVINTLSELLKEWKIPCLITINLLNAAVTMAEPKVYQDNDSKEVCRLLQHTTME